MFAPEGAPFLPEPLAELTAFPKSAHDDQVDALVQGLRYLTSSGGRMGLFRFYEKEAAKLGQASG